MSQKVYVSSVIRAPVEVTWKTIRAFNQVGWMGVALKNPAELSGEGDGKIVTVGCIRELQIKAGTFLQRLEAMDELNHRFTYSIIEGPLPVMNYVATMTVYPITTGPAGKGSSFVTWEASYNLAEGVDQATAAGFLSLARDHVFGTGLATLDEQLSKQQHARSEKKNALPFTRLLHTMIRVADLKQSIDFYTTKLGMKLLRTKDVKEEEFTLAFLGYGAEDNNCVLELTYNYGRTKYEKGEGYGHICVAVPGGQLKAAVEGLKKGGVAIDYLSDDLFMAFIRDPDGYQVAILDEATFLKDASKTH